MAHETELNVNVTEDDLRAYFGRNADYYLSAWRAEESPNPLNLP